ncbi:hypothetical protein GOACH_03_05170 [Gordonia aichiensis NBRC 108223]|uniref:DUF6542 domain-containing protein n=1 Tax=Gordonia aichiensis NBRC 108223 TaxID=1220583 RepID=L7KF63_9ACTN|nr:hypothetical protein GOACH_03_05170 [Gordonia aichiensis NBRC 108223]
MPVDQQSVLPNVRGIPWWGAVVVAAVFTAVGAIIDANQSDGLGAVFNFFYLVGCVVAVLTVRRRALFTAVAQPPLIAFGVGVITLYGLNADEASGLKSLIFKVLLPIANDFPWILVTFLVTLALGVGRWYITRHQTPTDSPAPTRRSRTARTQHTFKNPPSKNDEAKGDRAKGAAARSPESRRSRARSSDAPRPESSNSQRRSAQSKSSRGGDSPRGDAPASKRKSQHSPQSGEPKRSRSPQRSGDSAASQSTASPSARSQPNATPRSRTAPATAAPTSDARPRRRTAGERAAGERSAGDRTDQTRGRRDQARERPAPDDRERPGREDAQRPRPPRSASSQNQRPRATAGQVQRSAAGEQLDGAPSAHAQPAADLDRYEPATRSNGSAVYQTTRARNQR